MAATYDPFARGADPTAIGAVGHSLGGWTVLAAPDVEPRIRAVVVRTRSDFSLAT